MPVWSAMPVTQHKKRKRKSIIDIMVIVHAVITVCNGSGNSDAIFKNRPTH